MTDDIFSNKDAERLWELIRNIRIAMFTTRDFDGTLRARPMATQQADFDGSLWFFTKLDSPKSEEIRDDSDVQISYVDKGFAQFVSVSGYASIVQDKSKIEELWHSDLETWFKNGKDDPEVALIKVRVVSAEYWKGPSSGIIELFGKMKGALEKPFEQPSHGKVQVI